MKIVQEALAGEVYRVAPEGRLDAVTVPALEAVLTEHLAAGHTRLVLDLSQVSYMSSSGLRALLRSRREAQAAAGDVVLCGLNPRVREIFDMIGFASLFPLYAQVAEAAAAFDTPTAA